MAIAQSTLVFASVTPVCDTSAYAQGDVLFDSTAVTGFTWELDSPMVLRHLTVLDEDDQTAAPMTIYFLNSNVSLGTFNIAPSISDTNARSIVGFIDIEASDWKDIGGSKIACLQNLGLVIPTVAADTKFYVAGVTGGSPTQTASGIKLRFGFAS